MLYLVLRSARGRPSLYNNIMLIIGGVIDSLIYGTDYSGRHDDVLVQVRCGIHHLPLVKAQHDLRAGAAPYSARRAQRRVRGCQVRGAQAVVTTMRRSREDLVITTVRASHDAHHDGL